MRNQLLALSAAVALCAMAAPDTLKLTKAMGPAIAPITVEIYSDYGCSHCRNVHEHWLPPLIRDYVKTGKVRLLLKEFPLPGHDNARIGSQYAVAADRIGKYGPVTDALFRDQEGWLASGKIVETALGALSPAEQAQVKKLVNDPSVTAVVTADMTAGAQLQIRATPGIFVSAKGKRYPVDPTGDYSLFAKLLDSMK